MRKVLFAMALVGFGGAAQAQTTITTMPAMPTIMPMPGGTLTTIPIGGGSSITTGTVNGSPVSIMTQSIGGGSTISNGTVGGTPYSSTSIAVGGGK